MWTILKWKFLYLLFNRTWTRGCLSRVICSADSLEQIDNWNLISLISLQGTEITDILISRFLTERAHGLVISFLKSQVKFPE